MRSAIPFLLLIAVPVVAQQQGSTLVLGTVEMRLGMPKADVIAKLTEGSFELSKVGTVPWLPQGIEEWNVGHTNSHGYFIPNGLVDFRAGILWRAGKTWYGTDPNEYMDADLADALYGLSHNLKDEHLAPCTLNTEDDSSAELGETKHVALLCGGKYVDISINELKPSEAQNARPGVQVWEFLATR